MSTKMEIKKYYTARYLKEIEESELDFDNLEEMGFNYEKNETYHYIIYANKDFHPLNQEPISIPKLRSVINEMKRVGATHIEIEYHGDHHGYVFQGVEMRPALDGEIVEHIKKLSAKETKQARLAELYRQIKEIENEE